MAKNLDLKTREEEDVMRMHTLREKNSPGAGHGRRTHRGGAHSVVTLSSIIAMAFMLIGGALSAQAQNPQAGTQANQGQSSPPPAIQWTSLSETETLPLQSHVFIRAKLVSLVPPDPGSKQPYSMYISDNTGTQRAVIWQNIWERVPNRNEFQAGLIIDLYAEVSDFRGDRQLEINRPQDIRIAPIPQTLPNSAYREEASSDERDEYNEMSIGAISFATIGKKVRVRGTVSELSISPAPRVPTKVVVRDNTGEIEVVYWSEISDALSYENQPVVGQQIEMGGVISEWRGALQLKVTELSQVRKPRARQSQPAQQQPAWGMPDQPQSNTGYPGQ
ncbi:OB-fold nucleic acid binding domain-containing protein [bacterium]|nr:OB-fold nucleic acid binding domain-containing protein [bacterium]